MENGLDQAAQAASLLALQNDAARMYPKSVFLQDGWIKAVKFLRENSSVGYKLDHAVPREPTHSILHGYMAPKAPTDPITTSVSMPDEQVLPIPNNSKVAKGPWR